MIDTNNFTNQTGVRTFEAAAYLRRSGADVTRVSKMFRDDMTDYKAKAYDHHLGRGVPGLLLHWCMSGGGAAEPDDRRRPGGQRAAGDQGNQGLGGADPNIGMTVVCLSARSIDEVNVQVMMEQLGGGGHRSIAGAQLKDVTMEEAKRRRVKEVIDQMLQKGDIS